MWGWKPKFLVREKQIYVFGLVRSLYTREP